MANKSVGVPASAINRYNRSFKNSGWKDVSLMNGDVELRYKVRPRISFVEFGSLVMSVANSCFNDNKYRAWMRDYALRNKIVSAYTNIQLPDGDAENNYAFLMNTDIFESVVSYIDADQFDALVTAIDEQILSLEEQYNSARERELDEAITMLRMVQQKYNELIVLCNEIAGDEIRGLAARLQESAKDVTDEVAAVREKIGSAKAAALPQDE